MKITVLAACILTLALTGCGKSEPRLAGGKPVAIGSIRSNGNAKHRRKAVFKLGNACTTDPSVMSVVIDVLKDRDPSVRCEAILATVKNGRAARRGNSILSASCSNTTQCAGASLRCPGQRQAPGRHMKMERRDLLLNIMSYLEGRPLLPKKTGQET